MGLTVSWLAVQGADKAEVLGFLELVETGKDVFAGETPMSCREFAGGWLVLFNEDYDWADAEQVKAISRFGLTVGCQFSDHVGESEVRAARDGEALWSVVDKGEIAVSGDLPPEWAAIRAKLDEDEVDDAPQALAQAICGFRADDDAEGFVGLRHVAPVTEKRTGLFAGLFRKRG